MRTLIVEDEPLARQTMLLMLREFCPSVEVIGLAENGVDAVKMIRELQPELVFMDIDLPRLSGLDALDLLKDEKQAVIFITAHPDHVMKAIKFRPYDYLLKPLHPDELQGAVEKVDRYLKELRARRQAELAAESSLLRLRLPSDDGHIFVNPDHIVALMAGGNYTTIFMEEGKPLVIALHMKAVEELLDERRFFRCHHSYIINLGRIKKWIANSGPYLLMDNGMKIEVARRRKTELLARLSPGDPGEKS